MKRAKVVITLKKSSEKSENGNLYVLVTDWGKNHYDVSDVMPLHSAIPYLSGMVKALEDDSKTYTYKIKFDI